MELAKEKRGINLNYESNVKLHKKKRKGFFKNYGIITALVIFTLTFSIINIILIVNFFSIFANL